MVTTNQTILQVTKNWKTIVIMLLTSEAVLLGLIYTRATCNSPQISLSFLLVDEVC